MVNTAEQTAQSAENSSTNPPGYCLQWSRERAGIAAKYPDATTAWKHTQHRHAGNRNPPRGAPVYWTGGSHGYGHIAISLGGGRVRSTDAGGSGRVATVDLGWVEQAWGLPYAGWAEDINDVTIPGLSGGGGGSEDDMELDDEISNWSPDDGTQGKLTVGQTLNQARGYSEDTFQRVKALESKVDQILELLK